MSKTLEGDDHPDTNAQFEHINEVVTNALAGGDPVVSVDTKKKELVGESSRRCVAKDSSRARESTEAPVALRRLFTQRVTQHFERELRMSSRQANMPGK